MPTDEDKNEEFAPPPPRVPPANDNAVPPDGANEGVRPDVEPANDNAVPLGLDLAPPVVGRLHAYGLLPAEMAVRLARICPTDAFSKALDEFSARFDGCWESPSVKLAEDVQKAAKMLLAQHPILTAHVGDNSTHFPNVLDLHVPRGSVVADVTYGPGAFWRRVPERLYEVRGTDISMGIDSRDLPYGDGSIDCVVCDPPYMHDAGSRKSKLASSLNDRYGTTRRGTPGHRGVIELYVEAAREAHRVLKSGGVLVVKTQDEICSGRQCWTHVEIQLSLRKIGFELIDLMVLIPKGRPVVTPNNGQKHARKNHSYFMIFRKAEAADPVTGLALPV